MAGCSWLPIASPPNPRLVERDGVPCVIRRPNGCRRQMHDRPLEIVNSLKEKRAQDPILKYRANSRKLRDLHGKDSSNKKIERGVKGEDHVREDGDPREYIMGPEEGWKPPRKNMRQNNRTQRKNKHGYAHPTGRHGAGDPVPPPVLPMPYTPVEEIVWCEDDEEWDQLPDITADEVLAMLTVDERLPQGIDLSEIDTSFRELTTDITRSGHSAVFDGILDSNASLKVIVTNDYHKCEQWAEELLSKRPTHIGLEMFSGFINEPLPDPHKDGIGTSRVKKPKMIEPPAPIPIEGPLRLPDEDKNIYCMCLSTDETALVVQLGQMRVIGPKLRALLESQARKGLQHCAQYLSLIRKDGLEIYSARDITQAFLNVFEDRVIRGKVGEVCRRAGHFTWLKSITGVAIEEPHRLYPYMWGELEYSDEMVDYGVRRAFANFIVLTVMDSVSPSDLVGLQPKPKDNDSEQSGETSTSNGSMPHMSDESSYHQSSIQEYDKNVQPLTQLATQ